MNYFQCLVIRRNWASFARAPCLLWKSNLGCRDPSLGFATKARGLQGCGPRGSPGVTPHAPGSARE
jgi:hypothetical protein